ncbi:MAG: 23S rRNA (uracil(1939)-C(5))-methyltransferase RlmD, partial [Clostridia bacterium]|nr:23S rRNA (uracil(1939)-C(5))-methyltransferase RlmD [Clostridia bacterium]
MKKNDILTVTIDGYTAEGLGVCHPDGFAVFVHGAARGDVCDIRILKVLTRYAFARIERMITPADCRIPVDCPVFPKCGGCTLRHVSYDEELAAKAERVQEVVRRIGGAEPVFEGIIGSRGDDPEANGTYYYRNKAQFPVAEQNGQPVTGFYRVNSHDLIACGDCLVQSRTANKLAEVVCAWMKKARVPAYDEKSGKGLVRHVLVRTASVGPSGTEADAPAVLCIVAAKQTLPSEKLLVSMAREAYPALTGVVVNHNPERSNVILGRDFRAAWGELYIDDVLCGLTFRVHIGSFYQVNHAQAQRLYRKAREYLLLPEQDGGEPWRPGMLLDLYCGAGTIGLTVADVTDRLIGVEIVPEAIVNAKENAARNGITNADFICADAGTAARELVEQGLRPDAIIVDPPRKGLDENAVKAVVDLAPQRVVYVSCDPATLARDIKRFGEAGYEAVRMCAVDMFPRTGHVETV